MKKIAVVFATVFALVGGSLAFSAPATMAQGCDPSVPAVVISGGSVSNSTSIDLSADGGTAISDASGGDDNIAVDFDGDGDIDGDDIAAAGNAGTANAAANGGAIVVGDVNSGGNLGNVIEVGDTFCAPAPAPAPAPKPEEPKKPDVVIDDKKPAPAPAPVVKPAPAPAPAPAPRARGGRAVAALPDTGTGIAGDVNFGFVALALVGAVAAAGYSVRARYN
ncbi:MAG: hypothetical protein M3354_05575 [Chloroflexota bacterium]|nr:hypothetical protein [Chloroflexota bacterium]